jgi:uncharacterized small protein (DUF1192 family)
MDDETLMSQSGTIAVGEDLYGVSIDELEARIKVFETEITRVKLELEKKRRERQVADSLFGGKK